MLVQLNSNCLRVQYQVSLLLLNAYFHFSLDALLSGLSYLLSCKGVLFYHRLLANSSTIVLVFGPHSEEHRCKGRCLVL